MVEDREDIDNILSSKLKNLLKHLPCRKLKLIRLESRTLADGSIVAIVISTPEGELDMSKNIFLTLDAPENTEEIRKTVEKVLAAIPEKYLSITVTGVQKALKNINYSFNPENVPDSFVITKLPYRQLGIRVADRSIFVDFCTATYQKILAVLDNSKEWPCERNFADIAEQIKKRKELIVLLWSISNVAI